MTYKEMRELRKKIELAEIKKEIKKGKITLNIIKK